MIEVTYEAMMRGIAAVKPGATPPAKTDKNKKNDKDKDKDKDKDNDDKKPS